LKGSIFATLGVATLGTMVAAWAALAQMPGGGSQNVGGDLPCSHSPICNWGKNRDAVPHEVRKSDLGYTVAYPFQLPPGGGGVLGVGIDSKGHFWVYQRTKPGNPQLFEFDKDRKLIRAIGDDVIGHQNKAHCLAIDAADDVWIADENGDTVEEVSPEGKLIRTVGIRGQSGDWVESKGQQLLWQPVSLAFAPDGSLYIGEGHANESPNDTDRSPTNVSGASRVLHINKDGKFINQWYGNIAGPGHFSMAHGITVNPDNGNIYIGDREEYRLVVYTGDGKFIKTIQMRNLTCGLYVDPHKQLWLATGHDGQIFKIDWDGNVLGAIGNGPGKGPGQFGESNYMVMDGDGDIYVGDTEIGRVTEFIPPKK